MKKYFSILVISAGALWHSLSFAENIILTNNHENCQKIDSWSIQLKDKVAQSIGVPSNTLALNGGVWTSLSGFSECTVLLGTPIGPYYCSVEYIVSSDKGKTAFASTGINGVRCKKP